MSVVFYHWWDYLGDPPPYCNLRSPILLSIASLRAQNPSIPIYVLDGSQSYADTRADRKLSDWLHFPEKLNFRVIETPFELARFYSHRKGYMYLSRLFDLERYHDSETIIYSDADVFWFRDPEPLQRNPDKFCFDGYNTGMFYYHPDSRYVQRFFELFKAYTIAALNNEQMRQVVMSQVGYEGWQYVFDEMTTTFLFKENRELFEKLSYEEHCAARSLDKVKIDQMKAFHCNGLMVTNFYPKNEGEHFHSRGLLALIFQELYDAIRKVLSDNDLNLIFSPEQLTYYRSKQFPLRDNIERICGTKSKDGHYHIANCISDLRTMII